MKCIILTYFSKKGTHGSTLPFKMYKYEHNHFGFFCVNNLGKLQSPHRCDVVCWVSLFFSSMSEASVNV